MNLSRDGFHLAETRRTIYHIGLLEFSARFWLTQTGSWMGALHISRTPPPTRLLQCEGVGRSSSSYSVTGPCGSGYLMIPSERLIIPGAVTN